MNKWRDTFRSILSSVDSRINYLLPLVPEHVQDKHKYINMVAQADPTVSKEYTQWIMRRVNAGDIRLPEDQDRVLQALTFFYQNKASKRWKGETDLNKYTFPKLDDTIDALKGVDLSSQREQVRDVKDKGSDWAYDDGTWAVKRVTTPEAAAIYGKNTKWCTSNPETASSYLSSGPLYIVYKNGKKMGQMHIATNQFKDLRDQEITHTKDMNAFFKNFGAQELKNATPSAAFSYVQHFSPDHTPEMADKIADDPTYALLYSRYIKKGPWAPATKALQGSQYWNAYNEGVLQPY